jgi:hypothetical protein
VRQQLSVDEAQRLSLCVQVALRRITCQQALACYVQARERAMSTNAVVQSYLKVEPPSLTLQLQLAESRTKSAMVDEGPFCIEQEMALEQLATKTQLL